jgi:hypothetical protein
MSDVRLGFIANGTARQSIRLTAEKPENEDNLRVFLEPAEWDEEVNGPIPVIQLDVSTKSYIGETAISGSSAVERSNFPCMFICPVLRLHLADVCCRDCSLVHL